MNKRIKQLAEQAGSTHKQNLGVYQFYSDELEKFAESIIRECAGLVDEYYDEDTKYLAGYTIRKHFGLEK